MKLGIVLVDDERDVEDVNEDKELSELSNIPDGKQSSVGLDESNCVPPMAPAENATELAPRIISLAGDAVVKVAALIFGVLSEYSAPL